MKIQSFLICDDIRTEIGNKNSLIGVYDESIIFQVSSENQGSWPKQKQFGIFVKLFNKNDNPSSFSFSIIYNGNTKTIIKNQKIIVRNKPIKKHNLVFMFNNFIFEKPGKLEFRFDFYDKNEKLISTLIPDSILEVREVVIGK